MEQDTVQWEQPIASKGNTPAVSIPIQLRNYLNIDIGDTVVMIAQTGKHGKYIAFWKKQKEV